MDKEAILRALHEERARIDKAITALGGEEAGLPGLTRRGRRARKRGRPKGQEMSNTTREKIAAAQRKRWAKQKGARPENETPNLSKTT